MKTYIFYGYRDWAINIFKRVSALCGDQWILVTEKRMCNKAFIDKIKPDIIFFYGWSWMVPSEIVNNYSCLCLHPSPLPRYRGGSPIQNQVMNGEIEGAVTIFKMDEGLDSGDIIFQEEMSLKGYLADIFQRIEEIGVKSILKIIDDYTNEYIGGRKQKEEDATYCTRRIPDQSAIMPRDFTIHEADYFYNLVRCKIGRAHV